MKPYAMALSEHPSATEATGEAVSQIQQQLAETPALAVLFASLSHFEAMDDIVSAVRNFLEPECLLAVLCDTVIGGNRELQNTPAVALWAASHGQATGIRLDGDVAAMEADLAAAGAQLDVDGAGGAPNTLVLLADPFSFPIEELLEQLNRQAPVLPVIGGLASAAPRVERNQLWLDDDCYSSGAIGALVSGVPGFGVTTKVAQGCMPIGEPYTITRIESDSDMCEAGGAGGSGEPGGGSRSLNLSELANQSASPGPKLITELAGQPPLKKLRAVLEAASPAERQAMRGGVFLGTAVNEGDTCDFLVRGMIGVDRGNGAIAVGGKIDLGDTVQFHIRDPRTAAADLRANLKHSPAQGALLFTCNGRGANMFGKPNYEASLISRLLGEAPLAGMSCAGEIGPLGGQNYLLGYTASIALFGD